MRFRPYIFWSISDQNGSIVHDLRFYVRTEKVLIVSAFKSKVSEHREIVKRTPLEFLTGCTEDERLAFENMVVNAIRWSRRSDAILREKWAARPTSSDQSASSVTSTDLSLVDWLMTTDDRPIPSAPRERHSIVGRLKTWLVEGRAPA